MAAANDATFQYYNGTNWTSQIEAGETVTFKYGPTLGYQIGAASSKVGFFGQTPAVQSVLATGVGATADNIITVLQTLGLCKQS